MSQQGGSVWPSGNSGDSCTNFCVQSASRAARPSSRWPNVSCAVQETGIRARIRARIRAPTTPNPTRANPILPGPHHAPPDSNNLPTHLKRRILSISPRTRTNAHETYKERTLGSGYVPKNGVMCKLCADPQRRLGKPMGVMCQVMCHPISLHVLKF